MQLADGAIEQALANLRLQQANASADPDAHIGYKRTAGFNTLFAAVQIPLPIRNRNQGQIEAAAAELKAAEFSRTAAQSLIGSELAAARSDYEAKKRLLDETLIVLTADHGEELDEHGCWFDHHGLYEPNIRIPFVLRLPVAEPA